MVVVFWMVNTSHHRSMRAWTVPVWVGSSAVRPLPVLRWTCPVTDQSRDPDNAALQYAQVGTIFFITITTFLAPILLSTIRLLAILQTVYPAPDWSQPLDIEVPSLVNGKRRYLAQVSDFVSWDSASLVPRHKITHLCKIPPLSIHEWWNLFLPR